MKNNLLFSIFVLFLFIIEATSFLEAQGTNSLEMSSVKQKALTDLEKVVGVTLGNLSIKEYAKGYGYAKFPIGGIFGRLYGAINTMKLGNYLCFYFNSTIIGGAGVAYFVKGENQMKMILGIYPGFDLNKTPRLKEMVKIGEEKGNITKLGGNISGGPTFYEIEDLGKGGPWYSSCLSLEISYRFTYHFNSYSFSEKEGKINVIKRENWVPIIVRAFFKVPRASPERFFLTSVEIGPNINTYPVGRIEVSFQSPYAKYIEYLAGKFVSRYIEMNSNFTLAFVRAFLPWLKELPSPEPLSGKIYFRSGSLKAPANYGRKISFFSEEFGSLMPIPDQSSGIYYYASLGRKVQVGGKVYCDPSLYEEETGISIGFEDGFGIFEEGRPVLLSPIFWMSFYGPEEGGKWTKEMNETFRKILEHPELTTYQIWPEEKKDMREIFCEYLSLIGKEYGSKLMEKIGKELEKEKYVKYQGIKFWINVSYKVNNTNKYSKIKMSLESSPMGPISYYMLLTKGLDEVKWKNRTASVAFYLIRGGLLVNAKELSTVYPPEQVPINMSSREAYEMALHVLGITSSQVFSWNVRETSGFWGGKDYTGYIVKVGKIIEKKGANYVVTPYVVTIIGGKVMQVIPLESEEVSPSSGHWWVIPIVVVIGAIIVGSIAYKYRRRSPRPPLL